MPRLQRMARHARPGKIPTRLRAQAALDVGQYLRRGTRASHRNVAFYRSLRSQQNWNAGRAGAPSSRVMRGHIAHCWIKREKKFSCGPTTGSLAIPGSFDPMLYRSKSTARCAFWTSTHAERRRNGCRCFSHNGRLWNERVNVEHPSREIRESLSCAAYAAAQLTASDFWS
jgi:hypothetical protein